MNYPILKNYIISRSYTDHYHISGNIYNDDRFSNDTYVTTSRIIKIEPDGENFLVTTRSTTYICSKDGLSIDSFYTIEDVIESFNK